MKNIGKKERKLKQTMKFGRIGVSFLVAIISFLFISNNVSALNNFESIYTFNNLSTGTSVDLKLSDNLVNSCNQKEFYIVTNNSTSTTYPYSLYCYDYVTYSHNNGDNLVFSFTNLTFSYYSPNGSLGHSSFDSSYNRSLNPTLYVYSNDESISSYFENFNYTGVTTYKNEYNFDKSITKLYGIDYITTDDLSDKIEISFKYNGENKPVFNGIVSYGLKNYNGLYYWTNGLGYSSIENTGLHVGNYIETYEDGIYTLTLDNISAYDNNDEFEKMIFRFEFLWATEISDIKIRSNYLNYSNFNFNSFGYDYIIDNFNTSEFAYINFSTTLEEYRDVLYLIGTSNNETHSNLIFPDYFSTETYDFVSYGDVFDVYNNSNYGYERLKQFTFNIGTSTKTGFWLTRNLTDDVNSLHPWLPEVNYNHFNFSIAYKLNENLYFSFNHEYENNNSVVTDGLDENGNPNTVITDISISDDVVTPNDYKDMFTILNNFLSDLKETRNEINDLYNYFYNSLPTLLKDLHNFIIIVLCLILFIKVGVER